MNIPILLLLLMMGEQAAFCGCKDATGIGTFWGHDNMVAASNTSCAVINGEIQDCYGDPLPEVLVEIFKLEEFKSGLEWKYPTERVTACLTDESGRYYFDDLPPGMYEVRFSKEEFKTLSYAGIKVKVGKSPKKKEANLCLPLILE